MIVQIEIILGLYTWVHSLCLAAEDRRGPADDSAYERNIDEAVYALSKICVDRRKSLFGKWEHWYDGDSLINIPKDIEMTMELYHGISKKREKMDILNSISRTGNPDGKEEVMKE